VNGVGIFFLEVDRCGTGNACGLWVNGAGDGTWFTRSGKAGGL